ncbi:hypothetical protein C6I21_09255 [Alkalicoccus urumqiensis]|uniref:ATP-grasp domain-containing protein n=2 Tax=Alkalicoccus urumqiensis TaxID=1548213 RepID=A0A2P6MGI1_ALKUR|nr:hypothetical protein C6I21_09255 [Alkalicoccus urumqiensis]
MRGLREIDGVTIIGCDRRQVNAGRPFCDRFYQISSVHDEDQYILDIQRIVQEENVDLVFPSLHEEIDIYHRRRGEIPSRSIAPVTQSVNRMTDKGEAYAFMEAHGMKKHIPRYTLFHTNEELRKALMRFSDTRYTVAKDTNAHGALGFALLTDKEGYLQALSEGKKSVVWEEDYAAIPHHGRKMLMEYLAGQEYSVDMYLHRGKACAVIPRRRSGVASGIVLDGVVVEDQQLMKLAEEVGTLFMTDGFLNLQFMEQDGEYLLTDLNPRFCGSQIMSLGAGVNFPEIALRCSLDGECPEISPKWNTRMVRYRDQFFMEENGKDPFPEQLAENLSIPGSKE